MKCAVQDGKGRTLVLPAALEWTFSYGVGTPCDSFQVTTLWEGGHQEELRDFCRFTAEEAGERVFTGVVDEYRCVHDGGGIRLELSGRGMAALLLDNEAQPAEYQRASWDDIRRDHIDPYGIAVAGTPALPAAVGFTVATGSSEWSVLYDFACYHGGVTPRFDRQGRLVLDPWGSVPVRVLDEKVPVTSMEWRQDRYGVVSQVVVWDKKTRRATAVDNPDFQAMGGQCRRVITQSAAVGRSSAAFQIRASQSELYTGTFTVPSLFWIWPGELVRVRRGEWSGETLLRVRQTRVKWGEDGAATEVTVSRPDDMI